MPIGHPSVIEFSTRKLSFLLAISALFVVGGFWLITGDFSHTRRGAMAPFVGWVSIVFFSFSAAWYLKVLFKDGRTALILADKGFTYLRVSDHEIPWRSVIDIRPLEIRSGMFNSIVGKFVAIELEPEVARTVKRTLFVRLTNRYGQGSENNLYVGATMIKPSFDQLLETLFSYWLAARTEQNGSAATSHAGGRLNAG